MSISLSTATSPIVQPGTTRKPTTRNLPPYNMVLLNDEDYSVDYAVKMLGDLFGHPPAKGAKMAREVHLTGRVIVATTNLEQAELKREQIHDFAPDPLIERCKGSMSSTVETASE